MEKTYCPICKQRTNHKSIHKKEIGNNANDDFYWSASYEIVECAGCENIQFRKAYHDENMEDYHTTPDGGEAVRSYEEIVCYPFSLENHNELSYLYGLPAKIRAIYQETLEAFKVKSYILTGAGFRAVIEAVCIDKNIKGKDLQQKINNLLKEKLITEKESKRLHSIRFLGNDSIHEMLKPEPRKLYIVLEIIEHLLNNIYLIDQNAEGYLETVINDYEEFEQLIWAKCNQLNNGDEFIVKVALGKNIRRFEHDNLTQFIQTLISKTQSSMIEWLSVDEIAPITPKLFSTQKFKVKK